jgi:hypothetical protein
MPDVQNLPHCHSLPFADEWALRCAAGGKGEKSKLKLCSDVTLKVDTEKLFNTSIPPLKKSKTLES